MKPTTKSGVWVGGFFRHAYLRKLANEYGVQYEEESGYVSDR